MAAEFDTVATWTAEVASDLGARFHIPAGCRGSGSPGALAWLVDTLALDPADRMLDCGAGVGGPAAFARDRAGVRPILAEPEAGACRAARQLFGLPVVGAEAGALPFATGSFDAAWCLGVLCTTADQAGLLRELGRVLAPGGRLGLLVFTATAEYLPTQPDGNNFPTPDGLRALLRDAGLDIETMSPTTGFGPEPADWRERAEAVDAELERRHRDDAAWRTAQRQSALFGHLLATGEVVSSVLVVRPSGPEPCDIAGNGSGDRCPSCDVPARVVSNQA